jgi:hypothetical protein
MPAIADLYGIADKEGIQVERWHFAAPVKALYYPGPNPVIGLDDNLTTPEFRTFFGEELGHHFTSTGTGIIYPEFDYSDRLKVSKAEYCARKWGANKLIPDDLLLPMLQQETPIWEIAEYFVVTYHLVEFKVRLLRELTDKDRLWVKNTDEVMWLNEGRWKMDDFLSGKTG